MTEFVWQFRERFRVIRKRAKLNQDQFGEILGVSRQTVNAYENNRQRPPLDMMEKVCKMQDISPIWLLSGFGEMSTETRYSMTESLTLSHSVSDNALSSEQKALINFIAYNKNRADKLAHILMEHGLNSIGPEVNLDL